MLVIHRSLFVEKNEFVCCLGKLRAWEMGKTDGEDWMNGMHIYVIRKSVWLYLWEIDVLCVQSLADC